jgi:polyhydroxybutyrate depolymerase
MRIALLALACMVCPCLSCIHPLERCAGKTVAPGETLSCPMPDWTDRSFDVTIPSNWDRTSSLPVLLAIHGGGGNKAAAARVTCPDGETGGALCLPAQAAARGMAVILPDGTGGRPLRNVRTWNAGGGHDGLNCTSGAACKEGVDDARYFRELLAEVALIFPVDTTRIYATGISNGGAMSHRLACELPIAAIAAVGGTNQLAAGGGACPDAVPVLQIHGTQDPCWSYTSSDSSCLGGSDNGTKIGVAESMEGWRVRNGCGNAPSETAMPDINPADGTRSYRVTWPGCKEALELIRVEGGGHTWPNGYQYFGESKIGRVERDFGNEIILDFLMAHARTP